MVSDEDDKYEKMTRLLVGETMNDATLRVVAGMAILAVVLGTLAWLIH